MATHIKHLISKFLKEKKENLDYQRKIEKITAKFLGKKLSRHVYLEKIINNQLVFYSDASSFSYEFNLIKEKLLKEIKKELPEIEKIIVKIGQK